MSDKADTIIRARAPVRVDLAGGWTDVADFARETPGVVVNLTINLWTYATVRSRPASEGIEIFSADFETYVAAKEVRDLEYNGQVDLVKAAIKRLSGGTGISIQTRSDAPAGSGLGTSAALGVALLGALGRQCGRTMLDYEVAELASQIERHELNIKGGKQDHYASALGGVNFMEFFGETVRTAHIPISPATWMYLEKHLVLVYTGKSRLSGDIHTHVWGGYGRKEPSVVNAIEQMKSLARSVKDALIAGDAVELARLISANWECQKALHPSVTSKELEALFDLARRSGAAGGKACGAGGGGCVLFLAEPEQEHRLHRALGEVGGVRILPVSIQPSGLTVADAS